MPHTHRTPRPRRGSGMTADACVQAFEFSPVLEWKSLPFQIESLDTYGELTRTAPSQLCDHLVPWAGVNPGHP